MTPAFLRASLERKMQAAEQELKLTLPVGWPGEDQVKVLARRLKELDGNPELQPWLLRGIALRETGIMVGSIGFHTAPGAEYLRDYSPEAVEFGFTVFPEHRRQGFAREASVALMRWANEVHGVRNFVLSIRPDNHPSQALAAQLGFERIGSHVDEVDGSEDVLELRITRTVQKLESPGNHAASR
jgi:ribosomal-protein-alanine N-acetyltransferase